MITTVQIKRAADWAHWSDHTSVLGALNCARDVITCRLNHRARVTAHGDTLFTVTREGGNVTTHQGAQI